MVDWRAASTDALARELAQRPDLFDEGGFLKSQELFRLRCKLGAVVCVDSIPVRSGNDGWVEAMAVRRKTGPYAGKLCLVGGIVKKGMSLEESVREHFRTDLGAEIDFLTPWDHPVTMHQDMPPGTGGILKKDFSPDPTKDHNVVPVYLVKLRGEQFVFGVTRHGGQEVGNIQWFSLENMPNPEEFGYGHDQVFFRGLLRAQQIFNQYI